MVNNKFIFILSFMKGVQFFQPSTIAQTFCKLGMKTGLMKIFRILLTFYNKLVFREGIFGTAASLIPYFVIHEL